VKVAVIADVHGNLAALHATLDDIEAQGVDRLIVNGDLVNRGPEGVEVVERLQAEGLERTLGNHDDLMRKWVERDSDLPESWFEDPFWRATGWCAQRLDEAGWIETLAAAPMTIRIDLNGAPTVLVSHGSPRDYREGYGRHLSDSAIDEIVSEHQVEVLVGSHTHRAMRREWGRVSILNTGAVGTPFNGDPRAQYLILSFADERWHPEFRAVPYDRDATLATFETTGFLDEGGLSARIFYAELRHARAFLMPFFKWTKERERRRDDEAWEDFRRTFPERFEAVPMPT
jgi:predicted phosphodiesterase